MTPDEPDAGPPAEDEPEIDESEVAEFEPPGLVVIDGEGADSRGVELGPTQPDDVAPRPIYRPHSAGEALARSMMALGDIIEGKPPKDLKVAVAVDTRGDGDGPKVEFDPDAPEATVIKFKR